MTTDTPKPARAPRKPRARSVAAEAPATTPLPHPGPAHPASPPRRPSRLNNPTPASVPVPNSRPVVVDPDAYPRRGERPARNHSS